MKPAPRRPLQTAVCVEVFCGQAKLSRALRRHNFQVLSIDHKGPKGVPILRLGIVKASDQKFLTSLVRTASLHCVHFAPPCGTASAARNIRPGPPLRSVQQPIGLDTLTPLQQLRVRSANLLYEFTCDTVEMLDLRDIHWSIENPSPEEDFCFFFSLHVRCSPQEGHCLVVLFSSFTPAYGTKV